MLANQTLNVAANGHAWTGAAGAGYIMRSGNLGWGPAGALTYSNALVDPYTETGDPLLTQSVGGQSMDSLTGRAGLQATLYYTLPGVSIRPHTGIFAEREFLDGNRALNTDFTSAGLPLANEIAGYTSTYGRIQAGLAADIGRQIAAVFDVGQFRARRLRRQIGYGEIGRYVLISGLARAREGTGCGVCSCFAACCWPDLPAPGRVKPLHYAMIYGVRIIAFQGRKTLGSPWRSRRRRSPPRAIASITRR